MRIIIALLFFFLFLRLSAQDTIRQTITARSESVGLMRNGEKEGYWIFYDSLGEKQREGYYKNHLKDSTWKFYFYAAGFLEGNFKRDKPVGIWKLVINHGTKTDKQIKTDSFNFIELVDSSDKISALGNRDKSGKKAGFWYLFEKDQISYGNYKNNRKEGYWSVISVVGVRCLYQSGNYNNNNRDGNWTRYSGYIGKDGNLHMTDVYSIVYKKGKTSLQRHALVDQSNGYGIKVLSEMDKAFLRMLLQASIGKE
jgi:hypothetical protein